MRILVAHESVDTTGGVETYLSAVISEFARRGHEVALLYYRNRTSQAEPSVQAPTMVCVEQLGIDKALDAVRAWRPDICYSHNMAPLEVDRRLMAEWTVVKMIHGYFGTCVSGLKTHAFPEEQACGRTFGPACVALYYPRRCGPRDPRALLRGYRWARQQQSLLHQYASIVVASAHMGRELERHGIAQKRVRVVPLFSTLEDAQSAHVESSGTVLFAGRMTSLKGGHVLIAAVADASRRLDRPIPLIMAGEGPQRAEWERLAASLAVEAEFTGWIAPAERARVYRRAGLVAVPSLWPEPFGLVGLEAATLGIPAVGFDVGGIGEWLRHGRTGRLVDPAEGARGLADALASLIVDPDARRRLGEGARRRAAYQTVEAHVNRLESVLNEARSRN